MIPVRGKYILGSGKTWVVYWGKTVDSTAHKSPPPVVICLFTHASSSNYTKALAPDTHVLVYQLQSQGLLPSLSHLEAPEHRSLIAKTCKMPLLSSSSHGPPEPTL